MDYRNYVEVYRRAVEKGTRNEADMATEAEWMVLSAATQVQIIKRLQQETDI